MSTGTKISVLDLVELTEAFRGIPAGATGGALELMDSDNVMVEITSIPELDSVERIVFPPPSKLRRIGHVRTATADIAA